jgi:hypothetical protein
MGRTVCARVEGPVCSLLRRPPVRLRHAVAFVRPLPVQEGVGVRSVDGDGDPSVGRRRQRQHATGRTRAHHAVSTSSPSDIRRHAISRQLYQEICKSSATRSVLQNQNDRYSPFAEIPIVTAHLMRVGPLRCDAVSGCSSSGVHPSRFNDISSDIGRRAMASYTSRDIFERGPIVLFVALRATRSPNKRSPQHERDVHSHHLAESARPSMRAHRICNNRLFTVGTVVAKHIPALVQSLQSNSVYCYCCPRCRLNCVAVRLKTRTKRILSCFCFLQLIHFRSRYTTATESTRTTRVALVICMVRSSEPPFSMTKTISFNAVLDGI